MNTTLLWTAGIVVVALPLAMLALTEFAAALGRRAHPAARLVRLVRDVVLPLAAILVLLTQLQLPAESVSWTRVVATVLGFLILLVLLNGLNIGLFVTAQRGTWRARIPSIFVDIVRIALIVVGLGVLFSWVWGADVGGLFAALGVSSIVIGLALQQAVGPIVAGLFLLFEQPFRLGDWLVIGSIEGRVVEVNWRAVHLDTARGVEIIPNGSLATTSFANRSRGPGPTTVMLDAAFASDDAPSAVAVTLRAVAADLPTCVSPDAVRVDHAGAGSYRVTVPIASPADETGTVSIFNQRLWYAARRAGLALDGDVSAREATRVPEADATAVTGAFRLGGSAVEVFMRSSRTLVFGVGEVVEREGVQTPFVGIILAGRARIDVTQRQGDDASPATLDRDDMVGVTTLVGRSPRARVVAETDVRILALDVEAADRLMDENPGFGRRIGQIIDFRLALTP